MLADRVRMGSIQKVESGGGGEEYELNFGGFSIQQYEPYPGFTIEAYGTDNVSWTELEALLPIYFEIPDIFFIPRRNVTFHIALTDNASSNYTIITIMNDYNGIAQIETDNRHTTLTSLASANALNKTLCINIIGLNMANGSYVLLHGANMKIRKDNAQGRILWEGITP